MVNIKKILADHKKWLKDPLTGKQADLSNANLTDASLANVDLYKVNLTGANLTNANLNGADLSRAALRGANLYYANLRNANLQIADLTGANLTNADLTGAELYEANLKGVNLTGTALNGAGFRFTCVKSFNLGRHFGYVWKNICNQLIISIGCEQHDYRYWKKHYKKIGLKHDYSKKEIKLYKTVVDAIISSFEE